VDIVHISTPDHWHAKIAVEAMLAGKDVYCEKPMTLTIAEGRLICDTCKKTGRIVQIGTQQRSDERFVTAIAMIQAGRIGKVQRATCVIDGSPSSPEIPVAGPPKYLDWDRWLGPVPKSDFRYLASNNGETKSWSRCHYEFRWWYEYSGGKLTDWGAHHVDIATWGLGKTDTGPISINPVKVVHPVPFQDGYPTDPSRYNTATEFLIEAKFADDVEIVIRHDGGNGILFEGTEGRIFVNRGKLSGKPVEDLKSNPLPANAFEQAYKGRALTDHTRNFFESVRDRVEPISDVFSHHRALSTCHLAGIAARLNRKIGWDPVAEKITSDEQAQSFVAREYRKGFEIERTS
jgi:predicted dehydrogenase